MENRKIRVLGIAPYDGMKSLMLKLAEKRDDIDLTVYIGDLYKGVDIVQKNLHNNYDVIISRGGTAELIGNVTHIPVIEITLSIYDILRAIKLADTFSGVYAIVGFSNITSSAHLLCDLMQYKMNIITINNSDEAETALKKLKAKGYQMILCDAVTNTTAKKLGLNAILMTSGNESITSAFNQAVKLCKSYADMRDETVFLANVIKGQNNETVIFDSEGNLYFSSIRQENKDKLIAFLKSEVQEALISEPRQIFKNINDTLYSITTSVIPFHEKNYVVFYFSPNKVPFVSSKNGICFSDKKDAEERFLNSFYSVTGTANEIFSNIEQINKSNFPVMIIGEAGTGKEQVASLLYSKSTYCNNPMITINCTLINEKSWSFLTNHYNSPFSDNRNTIYFHSVESLPENKRKQLLSIIVDMNLCKRNRMIFSYVCSPDESMPPDALEFSNLISCLTLHLPPLREQAENIPFFSNLYLNNLNIILAKEIIGIEPEAFELMKQYKWPSNYTQFKRILNELAVITTTSYITAESVENLLKKENTSLITSSGKESSVAINLDSTLDDMNKQIIQYILQKSGKSQSAVAKQLGISRTTLWRLLKQ